MTKEQLNAKYVQYVQTALANNIQVQSFTAWNEERINAENQLQTFTFHLWSEQVRATLTITIQSTDKDYAFVAAKKILRKYESRFIVDNGAKKIMTHEERVAYLKEKINQKREQMQRRLDKAKARLDKLKQQAAEL
jgi:hypothetical protein